MVKTIFAAVRIVDCLVRFGVRCRYGMQLPDRASPVQAARQMRFWRVGADALGGPKFLSVEPRGSAEYYPCQQYD